MNSARHERSSHARFGLGGYRSCIRGICGAVTLLGAIGNSLLAAEQTAPEPAWPPVVTAQPIIFVSRPQYVPDHHNTETMFQTGEINTGSFRGGSAIRTIDLADGGKIRALLEVPTGMARDIDVHFSGQRVLFSLRKDAADDYHIYEMNADGSGLNQLTFGSGISDIDPIYLPDDRILFSSSREPKYCMCNRHIMCNLFTMDADGANIQQIGHSTLFEGHASLLEDGRVLYDRWEYVDRNFGDAQGAWICNPDGTNHAIHWGNNTNSPGAVLDNRAIPGTELFICTFSSCHDRPWGALAIVDRRLGLDGRAPVVRTWPAGAIDLVEKGNYDTFTQVNPKNEDPYPLSDHEFLCARAVGNGEQMGIYLVDLDGREELLHAELPGCFDPMPLAARLRPPTIPSRVDLTKSHGNFYIADVYTGTGMEQLERGSVKALRVVESPEKRFWTTPAWDGGTGQQAPAMAWDDFNNKRILGTVPVDEDGSAYFSVPADRFVYFQLLDERGMMIQSMRSGTLVRPGETVGCVGCHENRRTSVPAAQLATAMRRPPSPLAPWYGPERNFGYLAEVQPALDKHCVRCHDYGQAAGQKLNLAGDLGLPFNTSYVELRKKKCVNVPGAGPFQTLLPKSWGSHASRLAEVLLKGHGDPAIDAQVQLDQESFDRIVTWIDINAPYYPEYASAYRDNRFGRSPLDDAQLGELRRLTGSDDVNLTRPAWSLCLAGFQDAADPARAAALSIIEQGRRSLAARPRADMPGFRLVSETEIRQQAKYDALRSAEVKAREAIVRGEKQFAP
ncbi:MAG: HzsA-related protein [Pirellulaceae bacterium]